MVDGRLVTRIARSSTKFEVRIRPSNKDGSPNPENIALLSALDEASYMVARCRNVGMRHDAKEDEEWLDWFQAEHGRMPDNAELKEGWPKKKYSYAAMTRACPRLYRAVVGWLQNDVDRKWMKHRYSVLVRQTEARPHCKPTHPIPLPAKCVRLMAQAEGAAKIILRVYSTEVEGSARIEIPLVPRDDKQRLELGAILSGEWRLGQCVISRHKEKRGRWFVRLSYTKLVNMREGAVVAAVRRGMGIFLMAACSDGDVSNLDGGTDIVETKKRFHERRVKLGRRGRGRGAVGHGTHRAIAPQMDLSDSEARYSKERCRQAASYLVWYCNFHGVSEVVFEDFSAPKGEEDYWLVKKWPWFMLKEACRSAVEQIGVRFREVSVRGNRRRCPDCGHEHVNPPASSRDMWKCLHCHFERTVDQVVVLNMLKDVGEPGAAGVALAEENRKAGGREFASGMEVTMSQAALAAAKNKHQKGLESGLDPHELRPE